MHFWVKPAFDLMSELTYRKKLFLISGLAIIPLILLSFVVISFLTTSFFTANNILNNIDRISLVNELIYELEDWRDLSIRAVLVKDEETLNRYRGKKNTIEELLSTIETKESAAAVKVESIQKIINMRRLQPGTEAFRVSQIYDNAQSVVQIALQLRIETAVQADFYASAEPALMALANLVFNEVSVLSPNIGVLAAVGSYYLNEAYLDSEGAELIDGNLAQLRRNTESFQQGLIKLPKDNYFTLNTGGEKAYAGMQNLVAYIEDTFVNTVELNQPWQNYLNNVYSYRQLLRTFSANIFETLEQELRNNQANRLIALITVSVALTASLIFYGYLLVGFYSSTQATISQLSDSAARVARGDLNSPIEVSTHDEMRGIGDAMDVMRLKLLKREQELIEQSLKDPLTGLHNRRYFDDLIQKSVATVNRDGSELSVAMLDIDHFKKVNDTYGHEVGDIVLKSIALNMTTSLRRATDIVARFGGEEFAIILPQTNAHGAEVLFGRMLDLIGSSPIVFGRHNIVVTVSIGVCSLEGGIITNAQTILRKADTELYRAKTEGRNRLSLAILSKSEQK